MKMNCTNSPKYDIIAVIGKSASGKDSIIKEVAKQCKKEVALIQQTTTRPPRENENKNAYHFISLEEFQSNKDIIAKTQFREWFYGTDLNDLAIDKWNIGVFTPSSIEQLQNDERINNLIIFYIQADDRVRLERSLAREPQGDVIEMCRRMLADDKDFRGIELTFDYYPILNNQKDDFKKAINQIWTRIMYETFKKNNFTTYEVLEYLANEYECENGLLGKINEDN